MLPLAIDLATWTCLLVGDGRAALARLDMLEAAGARHLAVFAPEASPAMRARAGSRLVERLPTDAEVIGAGPAAITAATAALMEPWLADAGTPREG